MEIVVRMRAVVAKVHAFLFSCISILIEIVVAQDNSELEIDDILC